MKPIKRGFKLRWAVYMGFIKKIIIYQARDEIMDAKFSDYNLGEREWF